jgi:hypothetical protein
LGAEEMQWIIIDAMGGRNRRSRSNGPLTAAPLRRLKQ